MHVFSRSFLQPFKLLAILQVHSLFTRILGEQRVNLIQMELKNSQTEIEGSFFVLIKSNNWKIRLI